jgi:hypothetical protein
MMSSDFESDLNILRFDKDSIRISKEPESQKRKAVSPPDIPGLVSWLDPSDLSTIKDLGVGRVSIVDKADPNKSIAVGRVRIENDVN